MPMFTKILPRQCGKKCVTYIRVLTSKRTTSHLAISLPEIKQQTTAAVVLTKNWFRVRELLALLLFNVYKSMM